MIRYCDKPAWIVMPKCNTVVQGGCDDASNGRLARKNGPAEAESMAIHPEKGLSCALPGGG